MDNIVPNKVVRQIISEILAERGNSVINNYYRLEDERMGIDEETANKIGIDARLNGILASDVAEGAYPIKEIIDLVLTPDEIKLTKKRCDQWLEDRRQNEIDQL